MTPIPTLTAIALALSLSACESTVPYGGGSVDPARAAIVLGILQNQTALTAAQLQFQSNWTNSQLNAITSAGALMHNDPPGALCYHCNVYP